MECYALIQVLIQTNVCWLEVGKIIFKIISCLMWWCICRNAFKLKIKYDSFVNICYFFNLSLFKFYSCVNNIKKVIILVQVISSLKKKLNLLIFKIIFNYVNCLVFLKLFVSFRNLLYIYTNFT